MQKNHTKLGKGGRVIIPAHIRRELNLEVGSDIIKDSHDGIIYITTPSNFLNKLQNIVQTTLKANKVDTKSLVDELLAMRRTC